MIINMESTWRLGARSISKRTTGRPHRGCVVITRHNFQVAEGERLHHTFGCLEAGSSALSPSSALRLARACVVPAATRVTGFLKTTFNAEAEHHISDYNPALQAQSLSFHSVSWRTDKQAESLEFSERRINPVGAQPGYNDSLSGIRTWFAIQAFSASRLHFVSSAKDVPENSCECQNRRSLTWRAGSEWKPNRRRTRELVNGLVAHLPVLGRLRDLREGLLRNLFRSLSRSVAAGISSGVDGRRLWGGRLCGRGLSSRLGLSGRGRNNISWALRARGISGDGDSLLGLFDSLGHGGGLVEA